MTDDCYVNQVLDGSENSGEMVHMCWRSTRWPWLGSTIVTKNKAQLDRKKKHVQVHHFVLELVKQNKKGTAYKDLKNTLLYK